MRILVFQHIECEHPGMLRTCLSEHDVAWDAVELDQGDSIPKLNDYDALWDWSVTNIENFWSVFWDYAKIQGTKGDVILTPYKYKKGEISSSP